MVFQWEEVRDEDGALVKLKAPLSNYKSVVIREWNRSPYVHIGDVSKCFTKNGGFDIKKSKSVSLNRDDIQKFISMINDIPPALDRIVAESNSQTTNSDSDTSSSSVPPHKKKQIKKLKRDGSTRVRRSHSTSDIEDKVAQKKKHKKQREQKSKRVQPYSRVKHQSGDTKRKRKVVETESDDILLTDSLLSLCYQNFITIISLSDSILCSAGE